jgi:dihydrofolate synthase/folylpolyglutamate synthase
MAVRTSPQPLGFSRAWTERQALPLLQSDAKERRVNSTDHDRALSFLYGRINYERAAADTYGAADFPLERMRDLLVRLGNPQQRLKIVHVAGTKGKGSTSAMIAAVLSTAGYRTGLFTSPHLIDLEERIAVDGQQCSPEELVSLVDRLRDVTAEMDAQAARRPGEVGPTYFELTTAMALLHFIDRGAAAAVLEVGMGGRLDSTNACLPEVAVITSISLDHTKQLGDTLALIAAEKAGIIKPGVPVVSGVTADEPRAVIEQIAQERGSRLAQAGQGFRFEYSPPRYVEQATGLGVLNYYRADSAATTGFTPALLNVQLAMLGEHQGANAAVALATIDVLREQEWQITERDVRSALATIRSPARVEVIARRPTVIIDAAHNAASIAALVATLDASFTARRRVLIFACARDKDARAMLALALPAFDRVILTRFEKNPRGLSVVELTSLAAELGGEHCRPAETPAEAWEIARSLLAPTDLLCVTGSFFIAAEMRQEIERRPLARATAEPSTP